MKLDIYSCIVDGTCGALVSPMRHARFLALLAIAGGGCNQEPQPVVDLVVDSNRSGVLEPGDPTEDADENTWDAKHGAVFLANLDDDVYDDIGRGVRAVARGYLDAFEASKRTAKS